MRASDATPSRPLRLLCVLAHPDDESIGLGGLLARSAADGVETHLVTATRGEAGRYRAGPEHPGPAALARIREAELDAAAGVLGIRSVHLLGYADGRLRDVEPGEGARAVAAHIRRVRPHVVVTFGPDGVYGHADHIAVGEWARAAAVLAADASFTGGDEAGRPHRTSKLYNIAVSAEVLAAHESTLGRLAARVDGVERRPIPWPGWSITTVVDACAHVETARRAVACHASQVTGVGWFEDLDRDGCVSLWGRQELQRVWSLVGGAGPETDVFDGL